MTLAAWSQARACAERYWRDVAADEFFLFKLPASGRDVDISPDGTKVAVAHADSYLRLYNLFAKTG